MVKKFIRWMKFDPPYALNADGWVEFDARFKKEAPIRYFLIRGRFRKILWKVKFFFSRKFYYVVDRLLDRKHMVDTGLKPGYHNTAERMLHANFSLLVNFVENECARIYASSSRERMLNLFGWKAFLPWRIRMALKRNSEYAREYGLKYLNWCIEAEAERAEEYREVDSLRKVVSLYEWWTETRPNREEYNSPLLEAYDPNNHIMLTSSSKWKKDNPELVRKHEIYIEQRLKQEEIWDAEDEEMLVELVGIRKSLCF